MRSLAFVGIVLFGLYLLLAGEVSLTEIAADFAVSILILAFALVQRRIAVHRLRLPLAMKPYARPVAALLPDTFRVGKVIVASLIRRPGTKTGHLLHQPFIPGDFSPRQAGRRAVVELGVSLAPNAFAICVKPQDNTLLLHCLHPKQASPDRTWPS
jgi:hypothetical protein